MRQQLFQSAVVVAGPDEGGIGLHRVGHGRVHALQLVEDLALAQLSPGELD
jgi:hypothetical protein